MRIGFPSDTACACAGFSTTSSWFPLYTGAGGSFFIGGALAGSALNRRANASAKPSG